MKYELDVAEVCRLYQSGLSSEAVGRALGVSKIPILRVLREAGVHRPRSNVIDDLEAKRDLVLGLYAEGWPIRGICAGVGVGHNAVSAMLKEAGVATRRSVDYAGENGWHVAAQLDGDELRKLYEGGWTISRIAKKYGVGFGTVQRHLVKAGVELRPVSSVPTYVHKSPCAGTVRVRGSWELSYAMVLDVWVKEGKISEWSYESERVPVSDIGHGRYYLPDFRVTQNDGRVVFHEVKGVLRDLPARKIESARRSGFHIVLLRRQVLYSLFRHHGIPIGAPASS